MPTFRTPLIGSYNQRSFATPSGKDQLFKACIFNKIVNSAAQTVTWYTEKRNGLVLLETLSAGNAGTGVFALSSAAFGVVYAIYAFGTNSTLYADKSIGATINCGSMTGKPRGFVEAVFNSIGFVLITASDSTGWFIASDALQNTAYTCDGNNSTTITDIKIGGVNNTTGLYPGQKLSAASNIAAGTRVVSVNSVAFTAVIDMPTTGGAFNDLATTKEIISKITDADFPTNIVGSFAEMNGWVFVMTQDGNIYNSDLNNPYSWTAGNVIPSNISSDNGVGCIRYKNKILGFGRNSIESFYNAGNPAGSPLSSEPQNFQNVGAISPPVVALNSVFFLSSSASEKLSLFRIDATIPVEVPSSGLDLSEGFSLGSFSYKGQTIVCLSSALNSYWYSLQNNEFSDPAFSNPGYFSSSPSAFNGAVFGVIADTSGNSYELGGFASFQDNGSAYAMSIQIATDMGTNKRKFASELRLEADVQASGTLSVYACDDDSGNFTLLGAIDLTTPRMRLTGVLGSWEGNRLWKFEHSANTPFRARQIEIDYTVAP